MAMTAASADARPAKAHADSDGEPPALSAAAATLGGAASINEAASASVPGSVVVPNGRVSGRCSKACDLDSCGRSTESTDEGESHAAPPSAMATAISSDNTPPTFSSDADADVDVDPIVLAKETPAAPALPSKMLGLDSSPDHQEKPPHLVEAESLKKQGNDHFLAQRYELALNCYSMAIAAAPKVATFYSNRAFTFIRLEQFMLALIDASTAISIDPEFTKAYYHRATAYMSSLKYSEAIANFKHVIKKCPEDAVAKAKHDECVRALKRMKFMDALSSSRNKITCVEDIVGKIDEIPVDPHYDGPVYDPNTGFTPELARAIMNQYKERLPVSKKIVYQILSAVRKEFEKLDNVFHVKIAESQRDEDASLTVCGDTHGQFYDVFNIFTLNGEPTATNAYIFNGDFVDRGIYSVEVIVTLLAWKLACPEGLHLTRGNHETKDLNEMHGFAAEVRSKLGANAFHAFNFVFRALPLACVIENKIFVVHGGLPRDETATFDDIQKVDRYVDGPGTEGIMVDLLWADPGMRDVDFEPSPRGVSHMFGPAVSKRFLERNNMKLVIRSHEMKELGYDFKHSNKVCTVFSAPNYCGRVGNYGAFIKIRRASEVKPEEHRQIEETSFEGYILMDDSTEDIILNKNQNDKVVEQPQDALELNIFIFDAR